MTQNWDSNLIGWLSRIQSQNGRTKADLNFQNALLLLFIIIFLRINTLTLFSPASSAFGPVEARRASDSPGWPGRRQPDAGAIRQDGGRQHQDEALDGGDLCAFNRQRQAVVQVEVTSFSPSSLSLLLTVAKVKWCGLEQAMEHKRLHFAACWHYLLLPYHAN